MKIQNNWLCKQYRLLTILLLVSLQLLINDSASSKLHAAAMLNSTPTVTIAQQGSNVSVTWEIEHTNNLSIEALKTLPTIRYQGYDLPLKIFTVYLQGSTSANITIENLEKTPWTDSVPQAAALAPPAGDDWRQSNANANIEEVAMPDRPLFVVRQGKNQGQVIAVVAVSPLFESDGVTYLTTKLEAQIELAGIEPVQSSLVSAASWNNTNANLNPTNPLIGHSAQKFFVSEAGIQRLKGSTLAGVGLDLGTLDPAKLQLWHKGVEVPLQIDGLANGKLSPDSIVSFYADTVGDRWNTQSIYWLSSGTSNGSRMASRNVSPGSAAVRNTAMEAGAWIDNRLYESNLAGVDGNHWFNRQMIYSVNNPPTMTIPINSSLPRAAGTAVYSLTTSTATGAAFRLDLSLGNSSQSLSWHSAPNQVLSQNQTHSFSTALPLAAIDMLLAQGDSTQGLYIDQLTWKQPVQLSLGGLGARFSGADGLWNYQWQQPPVDPILGGYHLYDVTDPAKPVRLPGAVVGGFQDGPNAATYIIAGANTVHEPAVEVHLPVQFSINDGADAIYIAPAAFGSALAPLIAHRQQQSYQAVVVDAQAIYDAWSYGYVSADAIRAFLRFAHTNWNPVPVAVTLVGDGTWDPHNYENKTHHTNWIPPYVANVDPWIGEAACDNCYGQLDGNNAVTGDVLAGQFFATELWVGRLPVKSAQELADLATKLINYDITQNAYDDDNHHLFLADNFVKGIDANGTAQYDTAGDFAYETDQTVALLGSNASIERIYYDPFPTHTNPSGQQAWRVASGQSARDATLAAMSQGPAVVTYNGHAQHWQWGRMEDDSGVPGFLSLYDSDTFQNKDNLYISLSMTCMTSQFHKPADSGTVLDERQLLNPSGGAVAVWGPAGFSVAHGHDELQQGFYKRWAEGGAVPLGQLLEEGYTELRETAICCQDALQTFTLLGDPLTQVRIQPRPSLYLPLIQ